MSGFFYYFLFFFKVNSGGFLHNRVATLLRTSQATCSHVVGNCVKNKMSMIDSIVFL